MPDRYTSLMALVLERPVDDVGEVVAGARREGLVDRHSAVGEAREAQEVHWDGRMQKAVVRRVVGEDAAPLLRTEAYIGGDGLRQGMRRQARLLRTLADALDGEVAAVRDLSAARDRDLGWLSRVAGGEVGLEDAVTVHAEGRGTLWVHTHGAARLDVPDLELYGLRSDQVEAATTVLRHVHGILLRGGLRAQLTLPDGRPIYLVPARRAWQHVPLDWPGVGRAGQPRPGHEGPRASLSILGRRWLGRHKVDLDGVREALDG